MKKRETPKFSLDFLGWCRFFEAAHGPYESEDREQAIIALNNILESPKTRIPHAVDLSLDTWKRLAAAGNESRLKKIALEKIKEYKDAFDL